MGIYDYLNHFWTESEREAMSLNEASLYFYLLYEANRQRWAMPFKCSTAMIRLRLRTSTQNIMNAREGLMGKGLIYFEKGIGKGKPALYTLLSATTYGSKKKAENLSQNLTDDLAVYNNDIINNKEKEDTAPTSIDESRYGKLNAFLRSECPHIAQMETQMTEEQFYLALDMFKGDAEKMAIALRKMENSKSCTECHRSVFDTLVEWKRKGFFDYSQ